MSSAQNRAVSRGIRDFQREQEAAEEAERAEERRARNIIETVRDNRPQFDEDRADATDD